MTPPQDCKRCGHLLSLHDDGCCRWRDGRDFCLCIEEEPTLTQQTEEALETLRIEVETLRTLLAAWQKRCYEAERINPHGEPVDPAALQSFVTEMRERVIPEIVSAVQERQQRAAETADKPLGSPTP